MRIRAQTNILATIANTAGNLLEAEEFVDVALNAPIAVLLTFEHGSFTFRVRPEDDTIEMIRGMKSIKGCFRKKSAIFAPVVGKGAPWIRILTNQQGYRDGIQFEFRSAGDKTSIFVQHIAIASQLKGQRYAG